ncbi:MAG: hypothetical protein Q8914_10695 [Bacteroidota bacterium]|nr:hypothetical protein [Bacteroidota bacterium]
MRVLAIIFSMIMTFDFAQGQLSAIYTLKTKNKNVDCNIYFFKEGRYYMELTESATSDIIESLILSYGKYIKKGNLILFKDIVHDYEVEMLLDGNKLIVKRSFAFLMGNKFIYYSGNTEDELGIFKNRLNSNILHQERLDYKKQNKNLLTFKYGIYENKQGLKLVVFQSGKIYQLFYKEILISKGYWKRNGNELDLFDTALRHYFYALIGDKILISKLLPGDYQSCLLNKK